MTSIAKKIVLRLLVDMTGLVQSCSQLPVLGTSDIAQ
jgi:hypothetical protein